MTDIIPILIQISCYPDARKLCRHYNHTTYYAAVEKFYFLYVKNGFFAVSAFQEN